MYSSSVKNTTATGSEVSLWRPSASYAVYPDDYPDSTLDDLSAGDCTPDDYLQDDCSCRTNSGYVLDDCTAADAKARTPAGESSLCTNVQVLDSCHHEIHAEKLYYLSVITGCGVLFMTCSHAGVLTLSVQVATAVLFIFCCFCCCCCCISCCSRACDRS